MTQRVSDTVHYVSFGTPGGEYSKACRATIVNDDTIGGCVLNPTGLFFHEKLSYAPAVEMLGGTWHTLDECDN